MATSFKRSSACHTALDPAAGHHHPCLCQGLLNSQASLVQSLMGSFIVPSKSLFPKSCVSSGSSMVGLMMTSSKRAYAIPRSVAPRAPAPRAGHCCPIPLQETLKHSKAGLAQSLQGLLVCTRFCLSLLNMSGRYGV